MSTAEQKEQTSMSDATNSTAPTYSLTFQLFDGFVRFTLCITMPEPGYGPHGSRTKTESVKFTPGNTLTPEARVQLQHEIGWTAMRQADNAWRRRDEYPSVEPGSGLPRLELTFDQGPEAKRWGDLIIRGWIAAKSGR